MHRFARVRFNFEHLQSESSSSRLKRYRGKQNSFYQNSARETRLAEDDHRIPRFLALPATLRCYTQQRHFLAPHFLIYVGDCRRLAYALRIEREACSADICAASSSVFPRLIEGGPYTAVLLLIVACVI